MRRNALARAAHHKRSLKQVWQLGDVAGGSNFPRCVLHGPCRAVTTRAFLLAISIPIILAGDGWYRNVSHSWFAIWFANSLRAMSALRGIADSAAAFADVR